MHKGRPHRSNHSSRNRGGPSKKVHTIQSIVGRNAVREMLETEPTRIEKVYLDRKNSSRDLSEIGGIARKFNVPVAFVPSIKLDKLGGRSPHQGVAATISEISYADLEQVLSSIAANPDEVKTKKPVLLLLDGIEDTGNLGAILRSAYGFGTSAVIVSSKASAPITAGTVKASAGTAHKIPVARASSLTNCLQQLKERGYWIVSTAGDAENDIWDQDWDKPICIIVGGEHDGISEDARKGSDFVVKIEIVEGLESLNASVATAITLAAVQRGRK